ncbi:MAG: filamentous hemagglutinin family protein [Pseudomonadota bacterium]
MRRTLLGGVSLLALMMASDLGQARSLTPTNAVASTAAAQQAAIAAAQQSAGAAAQAQASLARAAAALASARQLQRDAAAAARSLPSSVPNGLAPGGLMPVGGTASDPLAGIKADRSKWIGAALPTQTTTGTEVKVDINQTQQKGIFYWNTFNVGANTTVNFNQAASDWIALNRIVDPNAAPSRILGQINALGSVYLINRNGIVFGAGSQVNVHSLIASSLDIGKLGTPLVERDDYFIKTGIANLNSFSIHDETGGVQTNLVAGDIKVEHGASITANITTDIVPIGSPGFVYLFGANVTNSGAITTPKGEVGMAAARTVDIVPGGYSVLPESVLGRDTEGKLLTLRGAEFRLSQFAPTYGSTGYSNGLGYLPGTGTVTHDGLIDASRGIVVMNGDKVLVDNPRDAAGGSLRDSIGNLIQGVISVDTSIERNSMVLLRAATSVTMNGVISSLPFDDGATLPSGSSSGSTVQGFTPAYIEMSAQGSVTVGSSGLVSAPSAQVALRAINLGASSPKVYLEGQAGLFNQGANPLLGGNPDINPVVNSPQTVLLSAGATIDVAGLQNVELPASYNFIPFKPAAEFADMPLQRPPYASVAADGTGAVYNQILWIDIRASGKRSDGTSWVGTPLADASGYVAGVGRSIHQLMTVGGSLTLKTDLTDNSGGGRVQTAGSTINLAGGSVKFLPGYVNMTRLLGADGRIYSMANADPNMTYLGIAGQFTRNHARWGVTETWSTGTQIYSPGYTEGHDAGGVSIATVSPVLTGTMYFGSSAGERQINAGLLPLQGALTLTTPSSVQIGTAPSANYTTKSAVTSLSADTLSGYGLSTLTIAANDLVVSSDSTLNLAPGGSFSVLAGAIDIAGTVSAAGGAINLVTDRASLVGGSSSPFGTGSSLFKPPTDSANLVIAANVYVEGTLDVSGRFVNDTGRTGTDLSGPGFIDGGSITITTSKASNGRDLTGSILLAEGSVLDVSSGGYISPQGKPKMASTGVMEGQAGSISLAIYQGLPWRAPEEQAEPVRPTPAVSQVAVLQLDGSLLGYGFESNGSLRLAGADTIRIGGTLQPGETSAIRIKGVPSTLPVSLLTGGGFGSYTIESVKDDWSGAAANIIVSAGVNVTLQQRNLSSNIDYSATATGTRLGQQAMPLLALLPDDQRKPVDLTLKANNILLDTGSTIVTDPKASIAFGAINDDRTLSYNSDRITLKPSELIRNVPAQNVEVLGSIISHGGTVFINALRTHLGSRAVVDLSGTFVANSNFGSPNGPITSGGYIAGGTFSVEAGAETITSIGDKNHAYAAPTGVNYLVADAGARLDVSGSAGSIQVAGARGATSSSLWSWSDAGTVNANVSGFAWGGSLAAMGGRYVGSDGTAQADTRANGGTVKLGGGSIFLRQDTTDVNAAVSAFNGAGTLPSSLVVAADQLSQFDNVYLYAASGLGGAARFFNDVPGVLYGRDYATPAYGTLTFTGALDWNVVNRLEIAAGAITAATPVNAQLSASYVMLTGGGLSTAAGTSILTVKGRTIDVEGAAFSRFSQINLVSSGDLRLSTPKILNGIIPAGSSGKSPTELSTFAGMMASTGDLLLSAQRIYPVSAVNFTIQTPGNVTFAAPAGSNTAIPLSAGGGLTVFARNIEQGGNLFAPLGKITLGNTDAAVSSIKTDSVTLKPGSLTSVTLADTIVPYGATSDGTNWYYNANLNTLSQPPSKGIVLAGSNVTRADGSTIDLRGGGDLQAMEWIQGKGGSRDTLATTTSGPTVYALVPSNGDPVSAFDIHFAAARSADAGITVTPGDAYPLAGTQITIEGGNGIPAGTYTLYAAHYATLPGAMRVTYYGDNTGRNLPTGTTQPDGTVLVAGYTSTAPGKQSSGQSLFAVQSNSVWQQYSEYSFNRANSYFTELAVKQNRTVPRLPMDAARLAVSALQSIVLNGIALTQPGRDSSGNVGRGGELDISALKLAVVGHAGYVGNDIPTGYVGLDITQLNGFESILIGGTRSDTTTGTLITPTANNVLVDTHGEAFTAPEILLVAVAGDATEQAIPQTLKANGQTIAVEDQILAPTADRGTVRIAAGSVIKTTGTVQSGAGRHYYFAEHVRPPTAITEQQIAAALGGTLDASGTVISGADLSKLGYVVRNPDGSIVTNPDGSIYRNVGDANAGALLRNYSSQSRGLNALFVASNDSSLRMTLPSNIGPPALTIQFAASTDSNVPGQVNGAILLPDAGRVQIDPGSSITANTLTLYATASTNSIVGNSNDVHLQQLNVTARTIGLGSPTLVPDKSTSFYNQQFADVQAMSLRALSGAITVYGDFNPGAVTRLTLDAAALVRAGSGGDARVSVNGSDGSIKLVNTGSVSAPASSPAGPSGFGLSFEASEIVLGGGSQAIMGYGQVNLIAANRVFVAGPGSLTLGASLLTDTSPAVRFAVGTPSILVAGATSTGTGSFAVSTNGDIVVSTLLPAEGIPDRPADSAETGGKLLLKGANVVVGSTIQAQAGTITLHATAGDVSLARHGNLAAGGYKKTLVDVDTYMAGGKVVLTSDHGNVYTDALSVIDVAQRADADGHLMGYGGSIELSALGGNAVLAGALRGSGGPGLGGRFKLDIKGAADLTALADRLLAGGMNRVVDIHTRTGNLELSQGHTLKANAITLTADDAATGSGRVVIAGILDADGYAGKTGDGTGQAGGSVGLFGRNAVILAGSGQILARTGGNELVLDPAGATSFTLPSTIVWFGGGTAADTVRFSVSGRYTTDGGATYTTFAANAAIALPANSAVLLDAPGTVTLATGTAPVRMYAPTHDDERGGDVMIGTAWSASGNIDLQAGSKIDVSGGTKGGLLGGTVTLRAPLDGNNDVKIAGMDATITGARAVNVQAFLAINTEASPNNQNGIDGSKLTTKNGTKVVWDGYIDPAGSVTSGGIAPDFGTWTNVTGQRLSVTPGSGYTAPPNIFVTRNGAQIDGKPVTDPVTGATYYEVTDPDTGTTFRSSLQVTSIGVGFGGSYTSAPTVTLTSADGKPLPNWGTGATATAVMGWNNIEVSGFAIDPALNGRTVILYSAATGTSYGNGTAVVSNGMLTGVININVSSGVTLTALPADLRMQVRLFPALPNGPIVSTGISASLKVTGVTVTGGGAGYSGNATVNFSSGNAAATATANMGAAVTITGVKTGYSGANLPTLTIASSPTGGQATTAFLAQTGGLTGATNEVGANESRIFIPSPTLNFIPISTSKVFNGANEGDTAALTAAPYQPHQLLYSEVLPDFVQGKGIQGVDLTGSYGFSGLFARLQATNGLVDRLGGGVVHVQPGIELVNTSSTNNSGNITVASNWNLASGTAGNLQTATNTQISQTFQYFDPASSYVDFNYRLLTPWGGLDAGALTLRAAANINVNASISDGFFQFGDYLDDKYVAWVADYLGSQATNRAIDKVGGTYTYFLNNFSASAVPIAPYQGAGNAISPSDAALVLADLFPHELRVCTVDCSQPNIKTVTAPSSWSYTLTSGADVSSANPMARIAQAGGGDVIVNNHGTYKQVLNNNTSGGAVSDNVPVNIPTMVRTGTGSITIASAGDVKMNDAVAPGVIYAAGVNSARLADPNYSQTVNGVVAGNADGFFEPRVLAYGNLAAAAAAAPELYYGPPTAAAFPEQGGDVRIDAWGDIVGHTGSENKVPQYYQPWLLSNVEVTPAGSAAAATVKFFGAGVFAPSGTQVASQTAWWIQYGSFQQGILSAGGNVSVTAGGNIIDVSVSLPTTGRVSGGLSATSTPVTHIYGSGNMMVEAGGNILGGSFYEGSGHARISAGGAIGKNGTVSRYDPAQPQTRPDVPLLAVDTGQIEMVARGSIMMAGVVNPAGLHAQQPSFANPLEPGGGAAFLPLYMSTYGPQSKVRLVAESGDLTITIAPTAIKDNNVEAASAMYPASFEALALNGSLITTGIERNSKIPMPGIVLSPSEHGTFQLLAQNSIDLTFGYPRAPTELLDGTPRPFISAGSSLIDTAFDPFQPNSGFDGTSNAGLLAHRNDTASGDTTARIYAVDGDITATGSYGSRVKGDPLRVYQRVEINRPTRVHAGRDIVDLNIIVQNIHVSDVSAIEAGRNISYTGFHNGGGLQVAGPGFFVVQAGGDIGPFLPAAHNNSSEARVQEGIASVGNSSPTPVGNIYVDNRGGSVGIYDQALLGSSKDPRRNALLTEAAGTRQGADIVTLFGTRFGVDYQAVINAYIDPANAANVDHNYLSELQAFLIRVGKPASASDPATVFAAFGSLQASLQNVFVSQVFFAELKAVGIAQQGASGQFQRGYQMINTMFPASLGYTANALGGGTNGANQLVKTGDLNLLHGTIQTQLGGEISLFGPGGNLIVGSLAVESNPNLKLRDLGILTLGGGAINSFTDGSVLVNSSRVLTTQGGDVLMWSSNRDLDAGRGSKTSLSAPALQVQFDQDDYQSIDLGGYVTGSGIGTLQASNVARKSNLYLLAPRGTIDAGTAGIRVSGNAIFVAPVIANASNIQVQGSTTGVPTVSVPNIGALTSGSNTAGAAAKTGDTPTASGNRDRASVFMVEVIGYGGGDAQSQCSSEEKKCDTNERQQ